MRCSQLKVKRATITDSVREKGANNIETLIKSFKTRCIEMSLPEGLTPEVVMINASISISEYADEIVPSQCLQLDKSRSDETIQNVQLYTFTQRLQKLLWLLLSHKTENLEQAVKTDETMEKLSKYQ